MLNGMSDLSYYFVNIGAPIVDPTFLQIPGVNETAASRREPFGAIHEF